MSTTTCYFELFNVAEEFRYEAVCVIHKDLDISSINGLRGLKSCHTGVGRNVGYKIPITKVYILLKFIQNLILFIILFFNSDYSKVQLDYYHLLSSWNVSKLLFTVQYDTIIFEVHI